MRSCIVLTLLFLANLALADEVVLPSVVETQACMDSYQNPFYYTNCMVPQEYEWEVPVSFEDPKIVDLRVFPGARATEVLKARGNQTYGELLEKWRLERILSWVDLNGRVGNYVVVPRIGSEIPASLVRVSKDDKDRVVSKK